MNAPNSDQKQTFNTLIEFGLNTLLASLISGYLASRFNVLTQNAAYLSLPYFGFLLIFAMLTFSFYLVLKVLFRPAAKSTTAAKKTVLYGLRLIMISPLLIILVTSPPQQTPLSDPFFWIITIGSSLAAEWFFNHKNKVA